MRADAEQWGPALLLPFRYPVAPGSSPRLVGIELTKAEERSSCVNSARQRVSAELVSWRPTARWTRLRSWNVSSLGQSVADQALAGNPAAMTMCAYILEERGETDGD